jgi:hypothetical protein
VRLLAIVLENSNDHACEMKNQSNLSSNGLCCLLDHV